MAEFDVFLAHNSEDKPLVREIAQELKRRNLKPWLDEEQIRAGQIFQVEIQKAIQNSKTAVIFIGKKGLGRWQEKELPALYGQFTPETKPTNSIPPGEQQGEPNTLKLEKSIDYTRLHDLLKPENWKEGDQETYRVMRQAVGKKDGGSFTSDELLNFPCTDLRTIDGLWVKYSNGHFGFSVQKEIYLSVGGKVDGEYYKEAWDKFSDRIK